MENFDLTGGKKLLLLGDSITDFGNYPALLDAYFTMQGWNVAITNLGISSENTTGLVEDWYEYRPRPCVLNRIDKILAEQHYDVVTVLYGVNDGIFHPFKEEIFNGYKAGLTELVRRIKATGAYVICSTPTYFEKIAARSKLAMTAEECSAGALYTEYDSVMEHFAGFVRKELVAEVDRVIDVHTAEKMFAEAERIRKPSFRITNDAIHANFVGHAIICQTILNEGFGLAVDMLQLIHNKKFMRLYAPIAARDILTHRAIKEHIGHGDIYKEVVLPPQKLAQRVAHFNKKIERRAARMAKHAKK